MSEEKGLTGVDETFRGFVSRAYPIIKEPTKAGRRRVIFGIWAHDTDISKLKIGTFRVVTCFDDVADYVRDVAPGKRMRLNGYVITRIKRNTLGEPIFWMPHVPVTEDLLFVNDASFLKHTPLQPELIEKGVI